MAGSPPYVMTIEEQAAAVVAALDAMDLRRFAVVGCSLGGDIGLAMAAMWPQRVTHFGLISASLGGPVSLEDLQERERKNFYSGFDQNEIALPSVQSRLEKGWYNDQKGFDISDASRAKAGPWLKRASRGIAHADFPGLPAHVKCPTLLIYGENGHFNQFGDVALDDIAKSLIS